VNFAIFLKVCRDFSTFSVFTVIFV